MGASSSCARTAYTPTTHASRPNPRATSGKMIPSTPKTGNKTTPSTIAPMFSAAVGAVADIVPNEVRHDRRVSRIVLRDAGLDLTHEIRADVRGLGIDAAAELREERHEARPEPEAHH